MFGKKKEQKTNNATPVKPTTQAQTPIAEVRNGIVVLKDGGLRLVMLCSTVNFDLKSEEEQEAIISGYQSFINSLEFPIQIVVQSRNLDLSKYIKKLQNQIPRAPNQLLALQIQSYISFIQATLKFANIMDKKFFVVIPYNLPITTKPGFLSDFSRAVSKTQPEINLTNFDQYKKELIQRAQVVASGLSSLGIRAVQLNTQELVELYYATYNPEIAKNEKLNSDIDQEE